MHRPKQINLKGYKIIYNFFMFKISGCCGNDSESKSLERTEFMK